MSRETITIQRYVSAKYPLEHHKILDEIMASIEKRYESFSGMMTITYEDYGSKYRIDETKQE